MTDSSYFFLMDRLPFEFNCKKVNQGYSTPMSIDPVCGYHGPSATVNTLPNPPPAESIHQAELNCKKANQGYSTPITVDPVRGYNPIGARGTQPTPPNPSLSAMSFPTNGDQGIKREITKSQLQRLIIVRHQKKTTPGRNIRMTTNAMERVLILRV